MAQARVACCNRISASQARGRPCWSAAGAVQQLGWAGRLWHSIHSSFSAWERAGCQHATVRLLGECSHWTALRRCRHRGGGAGMQQARAGWCAASIYLHPCNLVDTFPPPARRGKERGRGWDWAPRPSSLPSLQQPSLARGRVSSTASSAPPAESRPGSMAAAAGGGGSSDGAGPSSLGTVDELLPYLAPDDSEEFVQMSDRECSLTSMDRDLRRALAMCACFPGWDDPSRLHIPLPCRSVHHRAT